MKLAIMQPYFMPYIGYWQLIANTNKFIFFDVVQYNKKSWMNRNRILHPNTEKNYQYISIPIKKHEKGTLISKILINNEEKWRDEIIGKLTFYKKLNAKFYPETINLLDNIFSNTSTTFLDLIISTTESICKYLDLPFEYEIASKIKFDRDIIEGPGDWALSICQSLNAKNYLNPYSGYNIFDEEKYKKNSIDIKFIKSNLTPYNQSYKGDFVPGLSILDLLMFKSKEEIKKIIKSDFKIFSKSELVQLYG